MFQAHRPKLTKKKEISAPTVEEKENIHCGKHECALEFHSGAILYRSFQFHHFAFLCSLLSLGIETGSHKHIYRKVGG